MSYNKKERTDVYGDKSLADKILSLQEKRPWLQYVYQELKRTNATVEAPWGIARLE